MNKTFPFVDSIKCSEVIPPKESIVFQGQPNASIIAETIKVLGSNDASNFYPQCQSCLVINPSDAVYCKKCGTKIESISIKPLNATHVLIPDSTVDDGWYKSIAIKHEKLTEKVTITPGMNPRVKVYNPNDVPVKAAVVIVGEAAEPFSKSKPESYIHNLWPTIENSRLTINSNSSKAFTMHVPASCRPCRIVARSNSKDDLELDVFQTANVNFLIGVSTPIELFHGVGLPIRMLNVDSANRISLQLSNKSLHESRWVEIDIEAEPWKGYTKEELEAMKAEQDEFMRKIQNN